MKSIILFLVPWLFMSVFISGIPHDLIVKSKSYSITFSNDIDTTIVVSYNGNSLRYYQYIDLLKTGQYTIRRELAMEDGKYRIKNVRLEKFADNELAKIKMDKASIDKRIENMLYKPAKKTLKNIDTTMTVFDEQDNPLKYYQYVSFLYAGTHNIMPQNGKRHLVKINPMFDIFNEKDSLSINNRIYYALNRADKIIVKKSKRKLYLERNNKVIFECPVDLGKTPVGAKMKEGDGRTPEGKYNIDYQVDSKAAYYRGLHISYPNEADLTNAQKNGYKTGGEIMIHGTSPSRSKLKDWTNGCIAISNSNIDSLYKYIYMSIPIEIYK